jgi:hypothetical protein
VTVPVFGQIGGTAAILYGVYQIGSGGARVYRGGRQLFDVSNHPYVDRSPLEDAIQFGLDVLPFGNHAEDLIGGLP